MSTPVMPSSTEPDARPRPGPRRHGAAGRFRGLLGSVLRRRSTRERAAVAAPQTPGRDVSEVIRWQQHADAYERQCESLERERAHLLAWLAVLHPATSVLAGHSTGEDGRRVLHMVAGGRQMRWLVAATDTHLFRHTHHVETVEPVGVHAREDERETEAKYAHLRRHTRLLALEDGVATVVEELRRHD
ncbi:hypothetical protein ACIP79_06815 [Streptomyces sp. NPDC088747]|uniref:hypothetical protein n=1 Tax=Streptomyces sp. NPDC088747 TaxID=3365886 RepID=UPI00380ACB57